MPGPATIIGSTEDFTGAQDADRIYFEAISRNVIVDGVIIQGRPIIGDIDTDGNFRQALTYGLYRGRIGGDSHVILVPNETGEMLFTDLIVAGDTIIAPTTISQGPWIIRGNMRWNSVEAQVFNPGTGLWHKFWMDGDDGYAAFTINPTGEA